MSRMLLVLATVLCLPIAAAQAATETFHATMSTKDEVPPKTTDGKGSVTATLDTATKVVTYTVDYSGLTGPATAAHFHGPAAPGANAGVLIPFQAPLTSPIGGTATLTDAQVADLESGRIYANIHTATNPGGEIRGQMMK